MKNEFETLKSVCFSGHRIVPFAKQNEITRLLRNEITKSYNEGYRCFYCGMAIGFDLLAAKAVLSLKSELSQIKIIAVLPYREQAERWKEKHKVEYERILNEVDETIIVSEHYHQQCFLRRNDYMILRSSRLITLYDGKYKGGTFYTYKKAKSMGMEIINIYNSIR